MRSQKLMPGGVNALLPRSRPAIRMGHLLTSIMTSRLTGLIQPLAARAFAAEDGFTPRDHPTELAPTGYR